MNICNIYIYTYIYVYIRVCVCIFACVRICVYIYVYIYMCTGGDVQLFSGCQDDQTSSDGAFVFIHCHPSHPSPPSPPSFAPSLSPHTHIEE